MNDPQALFAEGFDEPLLHGVFVPEGQQPPPHALEPAWIRLPATFVPRGGRRIPGGQP